MSILRVAEVLDAHVLAAELRETNCNSNEKMVKMILSVFETSGPKQMKKPGLLFNW